MQFTGRFSTERILTGLAKQKASDDIHQDFPRMVLKSHILERDPDNVIRLIRYECFKDLGQGDTSGAKQAGEFCGMSQGANACYESFAITNGCRIGSAPV